MSVSPHKIRHALWSLILVASLFRLGLAAMLQLSVDESYYWLYALLPDWSHFDHPPMVGVVIQLFTLDLLWDPEWVLRLGPVLFSAVNTYLAFRIGTLLKDPLTGLYAALLYTASIYLSVLSGIFIIPDAPQMLFWMISLYLLLKCLPADSASPGARRYLLAFGLVAGLAIYSKYHGIFLWFGALAFILIYNRGWFLRPELYLSAFISLLFVVPILYWNIRHDFISFGFHSERVTPEVTLRPEYFAREIAGQVLYNNPVNFFLIAASVVAYFRGRMAAVANKAYEVLLFNALPLWIVFTAFSLFRPTLPHWTGPAYTPMIFMAAVYLAHHRKKPVHPLMPTVLKWATGLVAVLGVLAVYIMNYLPAGLGDKSDIRHYGGGDFTQDMYGWRQVASGFLEIRELDLEAGSMPEDAPIVSFRYFPAAFYDYYFAVEREIDVLVMGPASRAHNYIWINQRRKALRQGDDAYTLVVSNWYSDPHKDFGQYFEEIESPEVYEITRGGAVVRYGLVYRMRGYKGNFPFDKYR